MKHATAPSAGLRRFFAIACPAVAMLTGCVQAPKPLYHWDGYQRQVYEYLKADGTSPGDQLKVLEEQASKARTSGMALPPGYQAQLGAVLLRMGRPADARSRFEAEKAAFPESAQFMDFLIKTMAQPAN